MSPWRVLKRRTKALMMRHAPGMLTCAQFESFVLAYHEGELDSSAREAFERHMRMCPPCQVSFADYCRTVALGQRLFAEQDAAEPAPVDDRLVASILAARRAR